MSTDVNGRLLLLLPTLLPGGTFQAWKRSGSNDGEHQVTGRRRAVGEGSLYFDASKDRWVGAVVIDDKRRKVLARTKTEARQKLDAMRSRVAAGDAIGSGNLTVKEILGTWQRRTVASRDLAPATVETYRWCCERLCDELGTRRIRTLTAEHVESAFDRLTAGDNDHRTMGRAALIKARSTLGQALDEAVRRGHASRNVARMAVLTPDAARTKPRRSLTAVEARQLLDTILDHRLAALFIIMLCVGLRPGEAAGLTWDDCDVAAGRISIRHAVRVERRRAVLVDELKTTRSRRTITLPEHAADALRRHRQQHTAERLVARRWDDDRLVFSTTVGTVLEPRNVARDLRTLTEQAGLGIWTPNELRHSAASLLSAAGVPLEQIADLLGHASTRMLESTYRHSVQPSIDAAVVAMDRMMSAG